MSQKQQTVLRVQLNNVTGVTQYQVLDLFSSIPIKITRSYADLTEIKIENDSVEYDCSLFSSVGNLFGDIGNNLLISLNYDDPEYTFNHEFNTNAVANHWNFSNFGVDDEKPYPYVYPIVHNGYLYTGSTVNLSGGTINSQTRLIHQVKEYLTIN